MLLVCCACVTYRGHLAGNIINSITGATKEPLGLEVTPVSSTQVFGRGSSPRGTRVYPPFKAGTLLLLLIFCAVARASQRPSQQNKIFVSCSVCRPRPPFGCCTLRQPHAPSPTSVIKFQVKESRWRGSSLGPLLLPSHPKGFYHY
ncbi:hypothetical protein E2C01_016400 [Portunus trituberculatus]|uniref:Uncharacterized protein n=1 Tax=Portunus trituberculatus TaxID=210409 RepID=A0A5B7DQZ1_PORTR|nr:hypothetical protein [Portunus trituberculatus]